MYRRIFPNSVGNDLKAVNPPFTTVSPSEASFDDDCRQVGLRKTVEDSNQANYVRLNNITKVIELLLS